MTDISTIQQVSAAKKKASDITSEISLKLSALGGNIKNDFDTVKSTIYSWVADIQREAGKVDSLIVTDVKKVGDSIVADFDYLIDNIPVSATIDHDIVNNANLIGVDSPNDRPGNSGGYYAVDQVKLDVSDLLPDTSSTPAETSNTVTVQGSLDADALTVKASAQWPALPDSAKSHSFAVHASIDGTTWVDDPSVLSVINNHPALALNIVAVDGRTVDWAKVRRVRVIQYSSAGVAILGIDYSVAMDISTPVQFGGEFNGAEVSASIISIKFALTVSASRLMSYDELDTDLITSK